MWIASLNLFTHPQFNVSIHLGFPVHLQLVELVVYRPRSPDKLAHDAPDDEGYADVGDNFSSDLSLNPISHHSQPILDTERQ